MFSYIFMKILESRPWRYDQGINVLTGGHAKKIKEEIVTNWIRPGMNMLDVGCGTGELLVHAAEAGANVTGIDISKGMLSVARRRFEASDLKGNVALYHTGVAGLDELFADNTFDVITATLVFSELYPGSLWVLGQGAPFCFRFPPRR